MVTVKEVNDVGVQASFAKTLGQKGVVEGEEELGDVEYNDTSVALLEPASTDDVHKVKASVSGRTLSDALS